MPYSNKANTFYLTNWTGICLNPVIPETALRLSFANEKDTKGYGANFFKNTQSPVILHKTIG